MISVIIPVYNSAPYLKKCLDSVLKQTYKDLEVICVDDGSTDSSIEILEQAAKNDSRVKYLLQENTGVSAARNAGLSIAHGDYITFVDSDDTLAPEMYEELMSLVNEHGADIAHCGYRKIFADGTTKEILGTKQLLVQTTEEALRCLLAGQHFTGGVWNKLYSVRLLTDIQFNEDLKINEDVLFNVEAFLHAQRLVFFDLPLYNYYENLDSACYRTNNLDRCRNGVLAAQKILKKCQCTAAEISATIHLHGALCNMYREQLFRGDGSEECRRIRTQLSKINVTCKNLSARARFNGWFMLCFPRLYRLVYGVYNHLRKPNWDL